MGVINNIWWMLVLIGIMILIHELGHYWAARWFDVHVEAFSFGFGPRLSPSSASCTSCSPARTPRTAGSRTR